MENSDPQICFVSLGMVVLDELRLPNGDVIRNCVGGSGGYSLMGARVAAEPARASEVGSLIRAGHDFPAEIIELIRSWGVTLEMKIDSNNLSTRGLLEYHDDAFERKTFHYTTAPLQPTPEDLPPNLLSAKSFHLLSRPATVVADVADLKCRREANGVSTRPLLVWEPFPAICTPEYMEAHLGACRVVDVFSPNHVELLGLFGQSASPFNAALIEESAQRILRDASGQQGTGSSITAVVVRAGPEGCLVVTSMSKVWLPPYHTDPKDVVDATGGGNSFLGAFTAHLAESGDLVQAALRGSVAAGLAIEQIGLPKYTLKQGGELWNGTTVSQRLAHYHA
ncbi:Ribokinase-like protein [Xylariales sp. PMI_506]|nr:Ribokinase-like protein [Xylariales sp. PMI_506]